MKIPKKDKIYRDVRSRVHANIDELCDITGSKENSKLKKNLRLTVLDTFGTSNFDSGEITIHHKLLQHKNATIGEETAHYFDFHKYPASDCPKIPVHLGYELVGRLYSQINAARNKEVLGTYKDETENRQRAVRLQYNYIKDGFFVDLMNYLEKAHNVLQGKKENGDFKKLIEAKKRKNRMMPIVTLKLGEAVKWYYKNQFPEYTRENERRICEFFDEKLPLLFRNDISKMFYEFKMNELQFLKKSFDGLQKSRDTAEKHASYIIADKIHERYSEEKEMNILSKLILMNPLNRVEKAQKYLK